jgi:hypothetical protein
VRLASGGDDGFGIWLAEGKNWGRDGRWSCRCCCPGWRAEGIKVQGTAVRGWRCAVFVRLAFPVLTPWLWFCVRLGGNVEIGGAHTKGNRGRGIRS